MDLNIEIKDIKVYFMKRKNIFWGKDNFPYIENLSENEILINGLKVSQECRLYYIITKNVWIDYIN